MMRRVACIVLALTTMSITAIGQRKETIRTLPRDSIRLSDPCILADSASQTYYMTGTGGRLWTSKDLNLWTGPYRVAEHNPQSWMGLRPAIWAAELHRYKGKYYYFATFTNEAIKIDTVRGNVIPRRASHILVSDNPSGPYRPVGDEDYLPAGQPTLDGTFWVDSDGKPYMVYCGEWLQNWNGTIEKIELKPDLSGSVGKGRVLFRASDSPWSREVEDGRVKPNKVTDGPFLFRTGTGRLGMLWTSWVDDVYTQGVAYSQSGTLDGPWIQEPDPITPPNFGHGMLFQTFDGRWLMSVHSHKSVNGRYVRIPHLFEVDLSGDKLKVKAASISAPSAGNGQEWLSIENGKLWKTDQGEVVQAHAPGFVRHGGLWYMVGEDRSRSWNPDVNLYSSPDLVNWKFEKKIIQNGVTDHRLGRSRMIERAKLLYCEKTGKFVVWCHWESRDYSASEAACFQCDSVNGDYQLVWSGRPLGIKSRDCNVFVDRDGTAYFISTTNENQDLGLFRLSDDYLSVVEHTRLFAGERREAPTIVRIGDRYFMFSSACTGWAPNQCKLSYTTDLKSGWSPLANIGDDKAYRTQPAAILELKGSRRTTYLYVGDRWMDPDLPNTKTIVFPIAFEGTTCIFDYRERFSINIQTGEWRE